MCVSLVDRVAHDDDLISEIERLVCQRAGGCVPPRVRSQASDELEPDAWSRHVQSQVAELEIDRCVHSLWHRYHADLSDLGAHIEDYEVEVWRSYRRIFLTTLVVASRE